MYLCDVTLVRRERRINYILFLVKDNVYNEPV